MGAVVLNVGSPHSTNSGIISSSRSSATTVVFDVSKATVSVRHYGEGMGNAVVIVAEDTDADDDMVV